MASFTCHVAGVAKQVRLERIVRPHWTVLHEWLIAELIIHVQNCIHGPEHSH